MRILADAVGLLLLLALLTWLLLRGVDTDAPAYASTLKTFDEFALAEASLLRDVLQARAGLLGNYDGLVTSIDAMEQAANQLRARTLADQLDGTLADRLSATVAEQQTLVERFKSSNALLQNSLSYVGQLSTSSAFRASDSQLAAATGALATALLYLRRDGSPEAGQALQQRIDQFAAQAPAAGSDAESSRALLAHARLLQGLLPEVDETLKGLIAAPSERPLAELRTLFATHRAAIEATAYRYRVLLYFVSLLLLVMLVHLGMRLRIRALMRRRQSALERVVAENSTRLINCPSMETGARLQLVLGELGRAIGVERTYLVLDEQPPRVHAWCAEGVAYPPGWPDRALALYARLRAAEPGILAIPDISAISGGPEREELAAAGVHGWGCVPLIRPGRLGGIIGFDALQAAPDAIFPLQVMRLAGDAVANAVEREFLERERSKLTTRLERARRLQAVGSLASGIAHNFNNIVSAILGHSEMLEPQLAPGTKSAQHVGEIRSAAERARDLIDRILAFGRRREARARPVQVSALLAEASSLLRASLPSGVDLVIADVPPDVAVSGDPTQLQQVVLNLCSNAAQAMPHGGSIRITAEPTLVDAPLQTSHGEVAPGRYVCLAVADSGRGFDESVAQRLFEPFFTTRMAGTGLGLATVHEIVRDHDGAMNVQSRSGHGSRFEAWLPATAVEGVADVGPEPLPLGHGETVLVVESERQRLQYDEDMLAALAYEPVGFEHSGDAIAACHSQPDRFDVILVSQPPRGALEMAQALHAAAPHTPLLLATTSTADIAVDGLAKSGVFEVLRSPLVGTELAAALARCLRAGFAPNVDTRLDRFGEASDSARQENA